MTRDKQTPTLADLIDKKILAAMTSMRFVSLGTVQSFDPADQTATITVNYKQLIKDAKVAENNIDTLDQIMDYPVLIKCPVFVLTGGVSRLTLPIAQGDTCILMFSDREMDTWFRTGAVTFPQSERIHSLTDAIALVGIRSSRNPLSSFNAVIASLIDKTGERLSQAGDIKATARSSAPDGWLLCYGQAVNRTTYDQLFAAIGTTYGAGDGSTTFNVPDYRGRTLVGLDNMGGGQAGVLTSAFTPNRNTLGGAVGEEAHQLTIPEMPVHHHTFTDQSSAIGGGAGDDLRRYTTTYNTGDTGGDQKHNNVQPGSMVNWCIKI